jgi:hypothetical protein
MAPVHNPLAPIKGVRIFLDEKDVARLTGLSIASVRRLRRLGQGPKYLKAPRYLKSVLYRPEDVITWLESCSTRGGTQVAP